MAKEDPKGQLRLFLNEKRQTEAQPVLTGFGEIPVALIDELVVLAKQSVTGTVELQCASWKRESRDGKPYTFISFEKKWVPEAAGVENPGTPAPPAADDPFA